MKESIGFIGLGLMGAAMVGRLQDKGYPMTVLANRSRANVDAAVARGAKEVSHAREVSANSDVVMLCVSTSDQVESRMHGADGVIAGLKPGAVVIDFGTSLPASTRQLAKEVAAAGGQYLDAPLGRTPQHAEQGLLNIMAAGDKAAFDQVLPVLKQLGENVFFLGESGAGHTIKLLNNFVAATVSHSMSEAFAMADRAGVPRESVYEVMSSGPVQSGITDFIKAYALDQDPSQMAFSIKNSAKDMGYYHQMTEDLGVPSVIAPGVLAAFGDAIGEQRGEDMVPQLVDFYVAKS